jgi:hypothetical protein
MKIYQITWRDSSMYHTQGDNNYPFEVSIFTSIGFLLQDNKDNIVIARDIIRDESRSVIIIPKENILKIKKWK